MISHHRWKTSDPWRSCTVVVWGDIFQQQLCFCITVYNCMNRTFDGNHYGSLHSEPALLDFSQNASHAFKTCACTPESIFSLHWTWGETCDPEAGGGQQRKAGCPQPKPDRGCFGLTAASQLLLPHQTTGTSCQPKQAFGSPKSISCDPDQRNKTKSIPSTKALNPGSTAVPKYDPGEVLHWLGCGWEADTLW